MFFRALTRPLLSLSYVYVFFVVHDGNSFVLPLLFHYGCSSVLLFGMFGNLLLMIQLIMHDQKRALVLISTQFTQNVDLLKRSFFWMLVKIDATPVNTPFGLYGLFPQSLLILFNFRA